ncbi:MAG: putative G2-specific protein kinase nimA [Streblomastix strix]|uniref:non-specific serine/threonine protein kinase n=1 Tax=Streblomastix strix TaxID=222440 RepID=A0A5J4VWB0_9EUKA|nr:MAG: putative G2-specific protein kinase nimA [Streblomastix strix]
MSSSKQTPVQQFKPDSNSVQRNNTELVDNFDKYVQGERLGSGSFGTVYKVERKQDKQVYVWKKIGCLMDKEKEKKIINEVQFQKDFTHPSIVNFVEAFKHENNYYIVMEFCGGGTLQGYYKAKKKENQIVTEDEAWRWISEIAGAIGYLHSNRVMHRDLKPENVLLSTVGSFAKLSDFGESKRLLNDQIFANTNVGSKLYWNPELVNEGKQSYEGDIWGIGLIFHEILSQEFPFPVRGSLFQIEEMRLSGRVQKEIDASLYSKELIDLIRQMRSVDPAQRPTIQQILSHRKVKEQIQKKRIEITETVQKSNSPTLPALNPLVQPIIPITVAKQIIYQQQNSPVFSRRSPPPPTYIYSQNIPEHDPFEFSDPPPVIFGPLDQIESPLSNIFPSVCFWKAKDNENVSTIRIGPNFLQDQNMSYFARLTVRFIGNKKMTQQLIGLTGVPDTNAQFDGNLALGMNSDSLRYDGLSGRTFHNQVPIFKNSQFFNNEDFVTIEVYIPSLNLTSSPQQAPSQNMIMSYSAKDSRPIFRQGGMNWYSPTITFAVNGQTQINSIENIPVPFCFCASRYYSGSAVELVSLAWGQNQTLEVRPDRQTFFW